MGKLQLNNRVAGVKGNAAAMLFRDETFDVASSVHAIRNFQDVTAIHAAFKEMKRVTKKGGRVIVVETIPSARNKPQEAHIKMFNCKVKYSQGELPYLTEEKLTDLLKDVGLNVSKTKKTDFNLSVAPPYFLFNAASVPEEQRAEAVREYNDAVATIKKYGETSPPTLTVEAAVE
jgi:SAM-dependent methyltransferase